MKVVLKRCLLREILTLNRVYYPDELIKYVINIANFTSNLLLLSLYYFSKNMRITANNKERLEKQF